MTAWGGVSRWVGILTIVVSTVGCDRVTKIAAAHHLAGRPRVSLLADGLRLEYAENAGGFLSLGAALPEGVRAGIFTFGTAAALLAMGIVLVRQLRAAEPAAGLAFVWAGGIANLADRAFQGRVVDFLNVGFGHVRTGIFNVADVAILIGAVLVVAKLTKR